MKVSPEVGLAIAEAVKAGVFRRAQRLNPGMANVWSEMADQHSRRVAALLRRVRGQR